MCRQIDVEQRAVGWPIGQNLFDYTQRMPSSIWVVEMFRQLQRYRNARDLEKRALDRCGNRPRIEDVDARVRARIDARDNQVRGTRHQLAYAQLNTVRGTTLD